MTRPSSSKISSSTARPSGDAPRSGVKARERSKFELIAELGRGGMATVYLARARRGPRAGKLIVLKQLRSDLAENPEFLAMFLEEARLAGQLRHHNIVETFEVGQDDGQYYIAMEYLDGLSLQSVLGKLGWKGKFSFELQVLVLIEVLRGLDQAWQQHDDDGTPLKIVHRDVSPPNIILTFDGSVKLVDFGIAKAANSHVETRTGLIKGKLTYMAPEQAASGDVDSRTDIYSVGVMLWQTVAGTRRWKGFDNTEVLRRLHAGQVVDSPNAEQRGLPAELDEIVMKAIAAEPEGRYESANEFRAVLEALFEKMRTSVSPKDLGAFMSLEFEEARRGATEVIRRRLTELDADAAGVPPPEESLTAIRVAETEAKAPATKAKAQAKPVDIASVDKTLPSGQARTKAPSRSRSSLGVLVFIMIAALAAIGFLVLHKMKNAAPSTEPAASLNVSTTPPPVSVTATASPLPVPLAPTAAATATAASTVVAAPVVPGARKRHGRNPIMATPTPAAVAPSPVVVAPAPPPMPVAAAPTPVPAPATSTDANLQVDKQDPWKQKTNVDKADPWQGAGTTPQGH